MRHRWANRPRNLLAGTVLSVGLLASPIAAQAQVFGGWGGWDNGGTFDGLGPQQVRRAISQRGFRVLAPLRRNGNVFVADVLDLRGRRERLIVAAADAQILQRFYLDDRQARGVMPGFASRDQNDGDGNLVPPGTIPNMGRRLNDSRGGAAQSPRIGDLDDGGDPNTALVPLVPSRPRPAVKTVKPRVADRTPDDPQRDNGAVDGSGPRPRIIEPQRTPAPRVVPVQRPAAAASRSEPAAAPVSPVPAQPRRLSDPLAIPAGDQKASAAPVRSVSGTVTGAPATPPSAPVAAAPAAAAPAAAPKAADVPVAPLD